MLHCYRRENLLAKLIVIMISLAFFKEYLHAFRHVNPEEHIRIANDGGEDSQNNSFRNLVIAQIFLPKDLHPEIPFHDESAIKTTERSNDEVKQYLKEVPRPIVLDLEHDKLTSPEGIHSGENGCRYQSTEVTPPQSF